MSALQSYDRLKAAGFSDDQARAILDSVMGDLVTGDYLDGRLAATRDDLDGRLAAMRSDLEARIATLQRDLLLALLATTGLVLGSIYFSFLPRLIQVQP